MKHVKMRFEIEEERFGTGANCDAFMAAVSKVGFVSWAVQGECGESGLNIDTVEREDVFYVAEGNMKKYVDLENFRALLLCKALGLRYLNK